MTRRDAGEGALFQQKTGKKLWVARIEVETFDGDRKQMTKYSKTKAGAAAKLRELKKQRDAGKLPTVTGRTTVKEWLETWLATVKKPHVSPKSYKFYEEAVRLHIVPHIGARRLERLTAQDVRTMLTKITTSRNRQRAHLTLKQALDVAEAEGTVPRNVVKLVQTPEHLAAPSVAFALDPARALVVAAVELDACPGTPQLAARWITGLVTGARAGELIGLEWERINLTDQPVFFQPYGVIPPYQAIVDWQLQQLGKVHGCGAPDDQGGYPCKRIRPGWCPQARWDFEPHYEHRDCYRSLVWTRPKTKAGKRVLPLEWPVLPMLQMHAKADTGANPHRLVWHWRDGRPISPREDHDLWHDLLRHAGLERVKLHTLRHTMATLLRNDRVPDEIRMSIMGQSSHAAHMGYIHTDYTPERAALRELGQKVGNSLDISSS